MAKALPGQKINLRLDTSNMSIGATVTNCRWSITGSKFKDYVPTTQKGLRVGLEQKDLEQQTITFYWSQPGVQQLKLDCLVNGKPSVFISHIEVIEPASKLTSGVGGVSLTRSGVELVGISGHGIVFNGRVDSLMPAFGAEGEWQFAQMLNANDHFVNLQGKSYAYVHNGQWILDSRYPYNESPDVYPTGISKGTNDTPSVSFESIMKKFILVNEFKMYLMFKPPGQNSKWVPLRVLDWKWNWEADKTISGWILKPGANASSDSSGRTTFYHPEWTIFYGDGDYLLEN